MSMPANPATGDRGPTCEPLTPEDAPWVRALTVERWGAEIVVAHGVVYYPHTLPGFVALLDGSRVGLLTYRIAPADPSAAAQSDGGSGSGLAVRDCEVVTIDSLRPDSGVGTALIEAVMLVARCERCRRIWLITTNDNLRALRFYQRRGFTLVAVHRNALAASRALKPQIPLIGAHGIPLRDEIELELLLDPPAFGGG